MKENLTGKVVRDTRTGFRLLVLDHLPAKEWVSVVPARKNGERDRRFIGWSGSDKFLEPEKQEEKS